MPIHVCTYYVCVATIISRNTDPSLEGPWIVHLMNVGSAEVMLAASVVPDHELA